MSDNDTLTKKDLQDPFFITFFSDIVIKVIRRCFLIYSPIIITVVAGFSSVIYWGFNELMVQHKKTADRQLHIIQQQQVQDIKINVIESKIMRIDKDVEKLEREKGYEP